MYFFNRVRVDTAMLLAIPLLVAANAILGFDWSATYFLQVALRVCDGIAMTILLTWFLVVRWFYKFEVNGDKNDA